MRTQLEAVAFLKARGFKIGKSKFNNDVRASLVPTNEAGEFEEAALLGYAASAGLQAVARIEDKAAAAAQQSRLAADAELKSVQAERQKLKLAREQGLLMPREDHERDLAARATFFKSEVEAFIIRTAPAAIALVGGDEGKLQELIHFWQERTADWMDAWSQDREFVVRLEDDGQDAEAQA